MIFLQLFPTFTYTHGQTRTLFSCQCWLFSGPSPLIWLSQDSQLEEFTIIFFVFFVQSKTEVPCFFMLPSSNFQFLHVLLDHVWFDCCVITCTWQFWVNQNHSPGNVWRTDSRCSYLELLLLWQPEQPMSSTVAQQPPSWCLLGDVHAHISRFTARIFDRHIWMYHLQKT